MGVYRKKIDMTGKVVVITGGNSGIGLETARELARQGATVILGCRSEQRGREAVADIKRTTNNQDVLFFPLDLLNLKSVREFSEEIMKHVDKIDILLNNAGFADGRKERNLTRSQDKLEISLQTNHLSHFLLTNLLKDQLARAGNARVINVSSLANMKGDIDLENINYEKDEEKTSKRTYNNSKLMNILFSKEISHRWKSIGVTSYSLHPGFVRTNFFNVFSPAMKNFFKFIAFIIGKNNLQGAQTSLLLCCEPEIEHLSGEFFVDCKVRASWMNKQALDKDLCARLWERSQQLVNIKTN
eukprot:TRINITY_DN25427_c0_g1_i1.p1 TRINITY_DN25427_c0_g1~~TRINITY_DN25427_c0_g1_i1.p1  ORF type:complete len:350 (-),score=82.20 TRINITY_DN25427_c0_g1_i1:72-971(-)